MDGNLTNDGRWAYTWDAENRLTGMQSLASAPTGSKRKLTFEYDSQGRRVRLGVAQWVNNAWSVTASNLFVYDGWNVVAELNATNKTVIRSYVWGLDLSGSLQGAGGVGGLLAVYDTSAINHQPSTHFVAYDGNGNVMGLVNAADGKLSAQYEYGPFGEVTRQTGAMADAMPFRFSTKYQDDETDLLYYGYRYYNASTGRWLSRDPIEERGGLNLYGFACNNAVGRIDRLGLAVYDFTKHTYYREISFQGGDAVIHAEANLSVVRSVAWPFQEGTGFKNLECVLNALGFPLSGPRSGIYTASFTHGSTAWTLRYGIPWKYVTFFDDLMFQDINNLNTDQRVVTVYHELQGHNHDGNMEDGEAFNAKYEVPIQNAIATLRKNELYKGNRCAECLGNGGRAWQMVNAFDRIMCECGIPGRRFK